MKANTTTLRLEKECDCKYFTSTLLWNECLILPFAANSTSEAIISMWLHFGIKPLNKTSFHILLKQFLKGII